MLRLVELVFAHQLDIHKAVGPYPLNQRPHLIFASTVPQVPHIDPEGLGDICHGCPRLLKEASDLQKSKNYIYIYLYLFIYSFIYNIYICVFDMMVPNAGS